MRASTLALIAAFVLALAASPRATLAQQGGVPKEATISIELDGLPGRDAEGSFWEVSYQLRIADQEPFIKWSDGGENPEEQNRLGMLISKNSFTRRNLARDENRRFTLSVPLTGELLERFRSAAQRKQYVWMDGVARVHDAKLGRDFVIKLSPVWGPRRFGPGVYNVHLELSPAGELHWSSGNGTPGARTIMTRP